MEQGTNVELLTGRKMPFIGFGTWQLEDAVEDVVSAFNVGYKMIDTSSDYGTQPGIGEAVKKSGMDRAEIYLVTKVEEDDDAYKRTRSNLQELDMEYVDLMLIHRPPENGAGEELWEGLIKAKEEGLIRDIGVSNYSEELIDKLIAASGETPVVNQIEWSPFGHSKKMKEYCNKKGIVIQAYSPLTRAERLDDEVCQNLTEKYGKTVAQIILRWNLQQGIVPLPKASSKEHQEENLDIFDFELEKEDVQILNNLNEEYSSLGKLQYI
jgi:2,5-diketo-D-gluconate reductase A